MKGSPAMQAPNSKVGPVDLHRVPTGDTLPAALYQLCAQHGWPSAVCTGIGGVADVVLAYYDLTSREYQTFAVPGIVELVALNGNLTSRNGDPFWHLHAVVADATGRTWGGHLMSCTVALTIELAVWPIARVRTRTAHEPLGLYLLDDPADE
ncbi:MAG: DNA-binding protein [bacterium]|nr:DNA-binding protein [bacterium]